MDINPYLFACKNCPITHYGKFATVIFILGQGKQNSKIEKKV